MIVIFKLRKSNQGSAIIWQVLAIFAQPFAGLASYLLQLEALN